MVQSGTRQDVLNVIDAEERFWNQLVDAVGPDNMEIPGAMGDWTTKDLVAHVNGWRIASLNRLEGAITGVQPADPWPASIDYEDYQGINDWLHEQNRDRPVGDVTAETHQIYERMRALIGQVPDERLFDSSLARDGVSYGDSIVSGEFFSHFPDEHKDDFKKWLESMGRAYPERR